MKKINIIVCVVFLLLSCKSGKNIVEDSFKSITIDTILNDKISIRAILVDKDRLWFAADKSRFGFYDFKSKKIKEIVIKSDSLNNEFRSIAQNNESIFIANIGNPANIFKINKKDLFVKNVYTETHEKVFYDSVNFWNEKEGILIGDPIENCLSILITRDGGNSWNKIPCSNLPKTVDGEAAFAASNTNVIIKENNCWIVSGGKKSRVFYSSDKGKKWTVFDTPIVQGEAMTGVFTADFYNSKLGFVAGGNYENPEQNFQNKAISKDEGKTWTLLAENQGFGYASCVQFIPNSMGEKLVTVGTSGLYYSSNGGVSWKQLSDDKTLYTIRFLDNNTAFAAGKNKIVRIEFNEN
ncbi:MAG TPA: oxidoreductase [Flavobacterium sp.]|nr:oxidoreductase [Flavobacterium sp.]